MKRKKPTFRCLAIKDGGDDVKRDRDYLPPRVRGDSVPLSQEVPQDILNAIEHGQSIRML
jgi:hypothetical protein